MEYLVIIICSIVVIIGGNIYLNLKKNDNCETKNINNDCIEDIDIYEDETRDVDIDQITDENIEKNVNNSEENDEMIKPDGKIENNLELNRKPNNCNKTMMQYFEWNCPNDGSLWNKVRECSKELNDCGITSLWLPPAYKGIGGINEVGYGIYDLYDLGEFDQKGTVRTKYGTKDEYINAIKEAQKNGIEIFADIVFNHKCGADECEVVNAELVDSNDRNKVIEGFRDIKAYTVFNFPGRGDKYSSYKWRTKDFSGVDFDEISKKQGIFKFKDKNWAQDIDHENGNYDFLMGADIDMNNNETVNELKRWGNWYINETKVDGVRLDAIKHIKFDFFKDWLDEIRNKSGRDLFAVGEYWGGDINTLKYYIEKTQHSMLLFDVPLHYKFNVASNSDSGFDMRSLRQGTLLEYDEKCSVTFVDNHDTVTGQSLQSWVNPWFKLLAYTFILTRNEGYPCVFYGDYYGIPNNNFNGFKKELDLILKARKEYAYGVQHDYMDNKNIIGWTREGDSSHENSGLAALITNGNKDSKNMFVGHEHCGKKFFDISGNIADKVIIDENGCGNFLVNDKSHSIWVIE